MAAQPKTKQEVVSEFRCGTILEAARKVFAKKGFEAATVDDVAEAVWRRQGHALPVFPLEAGDLSGRAPPRRSGFESGNRQPRPSRAVHRSASASFYRRQSH